MLKLKYLFEDYDLAKEALEVWKHDEENLDQMLSQFRISSNAIYPFCQDGKVCFLRMAPLSEKRACNQAAEMAFIHYLRDNNFPALEPMINNVGFDNVIVEKDEEKYLATAFYAVKGVPIEDTDFSNEIMFEYGKTLGRLHKLSLGFYARIKSWSHKEALEWIANILQEYEAPLVVKNECKALKKELEKLPITSENYGLVHYDFEIDNVFYDEETKTCSVIDFDDSMYHWYAIDIEQAFDSLSDELEGEALEKAKEEFIRGYEQERPFTKEMQEIMPLMRRFVNLYGYARLIRSVAEKFEDEPDWLVELREKLNRSMKNKEDSMRAISKANKAKETSK